MFSRGTKITCINAEECQLLKLHNVYVVDDFAKESKLIKVIGIDVYFQVDRFWLPKFKVGDEAIVNVYTEFTSHRTKGEQYRIIDVSESSEDQLVRVDSDLHTQWYRSWQFLPGEKPNCPDCKGTGVYVGFTRMEPCRTCKV